MSAENQRANEYCAALRDIYRLAVSGHDKASRKVRQVCILTLGVRECNIIRMEMGLKPLNNIAPARMVAAA